MKKLILLITIFTSSMLSTIAPIPTTIVLYINDNTLAKPTTLDKDWLSSMGNLKNDVTTETNQYAIDLGIDLTEFNCAPINLVIGFLDVNPNLASPAYYRIEQPINSIPDDITLLAYIQDQVNSDDYAGVIIGDLEEISAHLSCTY